jgi:ABC-type uncharacterized transport system permease subunit
MTHGSPSVERKLPAIAQICVLVLVSIVIGGVYVAAHLPDHVSIKFPTLMIGLGGGHHRRNAGVHLHL